MPTERAIQIAQSASKMLELGAKHTDLAGTNPDYLEYVTAMYEFSMLVSKTAYVAVSSKDRLNAKLLMDTLCMGLRSCFPDYLSISEELIAAATDYVNVYMEGELTKEEDAYVIDQMKLASGRLLQQYPGHAAVAAYNQACAEA